jgi:hypothetical protein
LASFQTLSVHLHRYEIVLTDGQAALERGMILNELIDHGGEILVGKLPGAHDGAFYRGDREIQESRLCMLEVIFGAVLQDFNMTPVNGRYLVEEDL